jgi:hypothetical protein
MSAKLISQAPKGPTNKPAPTPIGCSIVKERAYREARLATNPLKQSPLF